jgi:hypothetical protein
MIKKLCGCIGFSWACLGSGAALAAAAPEHNIDWSARARLADFYGDESARAASLLLRLNVGTQWSEYLSSQVQVDNVSRGFKHEHSDGVDLNGKPIIPDAGGLDLNEAYLAIKVDAWNIKLGRQQINWDDQRFIGGNGFWQNEQTFDALLANIKLFSNSQLSYAYIGNVNRIFGDDADKRLPSNGGGYGADAAERPVNLLGDHEHHTHIARLDLNEWDYSELVAYAYAIDNLTAPRTSNNTLGAHYTFTYKMDAIKYRLKLESALQKQPELSDSPLLPYYLLDASLGISHLEVSGRYEILSHKDNANFIMPLGSSHDFQGASGQIQNYKAQGLKDASLGLTWRATPFKIETQYHRFNAYTSNEYLGQELDITLSYKPSRKHVVSFLTAYFKPELDSAVEKDTTHFYLDYAYNF